MEITVNVIGLGLGIADYLERLGFTVIRYHPAARNPVTPSGFYLDYV
jgi:hypothetical protein